MVLLRGSAGAAALLAALRTASALVLHGPDATQDTSDLERDATRLRAEIASLQEQIWQRHAGRSGVTGDLEEFLPHHREADAAELRSGEDVIPEKVSLGARSTRGATAKEAEQMQEAMDLFAEQRAAQEALKHREGQGDEVDRMLASTQDPEKELRLAKKNSHVLNTGYTKAKPCPEGEDCVVRSMTNQRGNTHKPIIVQLNRGRLGHHMFQWAAALSIAKELKKDQFRLVLREGEYECANTTQMLRLRSVAWSPQDYEYLQGNNQKCHVWDKLPLVLDSNMTNFGDRTSWGAPKGSDHTPGDYNETHDGNLAMAVAQTIMKTKLPSKDHKCHIFEMDGYFLNQGFFKEHLAMVSQAFWDDSSAEHAESTLRWLLWNNQEGSSVGIHVRFGDEEFMGRNLPLQYYNDALEEVSKHTNERLTCVIFSDKLEKAMKRSRHFDLCETRIPMTPGLSDQRTFYMMSMLPNLIIADSTYSFWAARISPGDPFVVSPKIVTSAPHLKEEYAYLTQTPGWASVATRLGPVGPRARVEFDEQFKEIEMEQKVPSGFMKLGKGYCRNGYYAGHDAADAADIITCATKCQSESRCMFFALQRGKTCSRYSNYAGECDLSVARGQETHTTFAKMSDDNVAMRGAVSQLNSLGRHVIPTGRYSADEMTIAELSQLDGYSAPTSEWAY
jgi:hypothetical protein